MIINRIVFENYGLFAGKNEFDLRPRTIDGKIRPIILFGGKNGAGKTTFLDAIRLALYGRQAAGSRLSQREYNEILRNRIHRQKSSQDGPGFAKVGVEFEFVTCGERNRYYIERSWIRRQADSVDEFFRVEKDGKLLDDISVDQWESFIADVVPERLSQLFFFDGEKIKLIAEDITGNDAICRSIHTLLGLDIVERLKADLSIYSSRIAKSENPELFEKELSAVQAELELVRSRIQEIDGSDMPALKTEQQGLANDVNRLETQLKEQGGSFAEKRDQNRRKHDQFDAFINEINRRIRHECEDSLPFALCPTVGMRLLEELEQESLQRKATALLGEIGVLRKSINSALHSAKDRSISSAKNAIATILDQSFATFRKRFDSGSACKPLHNLSDIESSTIKETISSKAKSSCLAAVRATRDLERANQELHETKRRLKETPDQEILRPTFDALADAHQTLGALNLQIGQIEDERLELENKKAALKRQEERWISRIAETSSASEKLETIKRIIPALDKYRDRLTKLKISALETAVTERFNRLARKTEFVRSISIDPDTFAVHVNDKQGRNIPKEDLSSGEKQMFAISMLWGLAMTSGRALPVVVDTPLGRLDSDHRRNLVEHYFPKASQQVILLSTDTEVDQPLFEALMPHISHCYHLRYDNTAEATIPEERYFWKTK